MEANGLDKSQVQKLTFPILVSALPPSSSFSANMNVNGANGAPAGGLPQKAAYVPPHMRGAAPAFSPR